MAVRDQGIKVTGAKELRKQLRQAGPDMRKQLRKANKDAAALVSAEAKSRSPVIEGDLRDSIRPLGSESKAVVAIGKGRSRQWAGRVIFGDPSPGIFGDDFPFEALADEWPEVYDFYVEAVEHIAKQLTTSR